MVIKSTLEYPHINSAIKLRASLIQDSIKYCYFLMGHIVMGFPSPLSYC